MDPNIYNRPNADLERGKEVKGKSVKAIIVGISIDIGGTIIFATVLGMVVGAYYATQGMSPEAIQDKLSQLDIFSLYGIIGSIGGTLFSILAGYMCAKISINKIKRDILILALINSGLGFLMGMVNASLIENMIFALITVAAIAVGAYLYTRLQRKEKASFLV